MIPGSTMTDSATRPVAIKLDEDTRARIKRLAETRQRSSHWLMREAIAQYVEREERREALRQDALLAWRDFQATGLHVPAAAADEWFARLERGDEVAPPEPQR